MTFSRFKKVAIILSLGLLPCTMLSAAHAASHMLEARISMAQESTGSMTTPPADPQVTQQLASHVARVGLPLQDALVLSNIAMTLASLQMATLNMQAELMEGQAMQDQESVLMSQATATEMNEQIQLANTQIQEVLSDMNAAIVSAGSVLSSMSSLSQENLGQLH